jgi:hypothetical protein
MDQLSNIDMHGNALLHAKVVISDRENIESDDIIDKQALDESEIYSTDFSDPSTGLNAGKPLVAFGGITEDTIVDGKTNKQLWDLAFYPLQHPTYVQPTVSLSCTFLHPDTLAVLSAQYEVGQLVIARLTVTTTLNDSAGLSGSLPYTWSGSGLSVAEQTGLNTVDISFNIGLSNSWSVSTVFQGSAIKNDSHGNPDSTGIFGIVTKTSTASKTSYWPYYATVLSGNIAAPVSSEDVVTLSGKVLATTPTTITITIPAGSTKTLILAVPSATATVSMIKDGALPIAPAAITKTTVSNVLATGTSGLSTTYSIFRHTNGVGYANDSVYTITIANL